MAMLNNQRVSWEKWDEHGITFPELKISPAKPAKPAGFFFGVKRSNLRGYHRCCFMFSSFYPSHLEVVPTGLTQRNPTNNWNAVAQFRSWSSVDHLASSAVYSAMRLGKTSRFKLAPRISTWIPIARASPPLRPASKIILCFFDVAIVRYLHLSGKKHIHIQSSGWWFGTCFIFPFSCFFIIPTDEPHHFSEG